MRPPVSTPHTAVSNWQPATVSGQMNVREAKRLGSPRGGQRRATEGQLKLTVGQRMILDTQPVRVGKQSPNCDWQMTNCEGHVASCVGQKDSRVAQLSKTDGQLKPVWKTPMFGSKPPPPTLCGATPPGKPTCGWYGSSTTVKSIGVHPLKPDSTQ